MLIVLKDPLKMEYNIEIYAQREYIFLVALNKIKKSDRSEFKKKVLKMMIDYNVDQTDLARFEGVTPQAINNRLKRLNKDRYQAFKDLTITISNGQDS